MGGYAPGDGVPHNGERIAQETVAC